MLANSVRVATHFLDRAKGLLFTPELKPGEGMYISPCGSIHTFFMRYPIDVLFIDAHRKVLSQKIYHPWKMSGIQRHAEGALELPAGTLAKTRTQVGDTLEFGEAL